VRKLAADDMPILYAVIASGFNISGDINLTQRQLEAIFVPTVNSGDLAFQGNIDTTSAQFVRALSGSGDLLLPVEAGSRMIYGPEMALFTPAYARLEMVMAAGSLQTDNRTFTLVARAR